MRKKFAREIIAKFDRDGDGKLDENELVGFMEEQRKAFESGMQRRGPRREFTPPKEILAKFDKDGDGKLSREERRSMFEEARKKREELFKNTMRTATGNSAIRKRQSSFRIPRFRI